MGKYFSIKLLLFFIFSGNTVSGQIIVRNVCPYPIKLNTHTGNEKLLNTNDSIKYTPEPGSFAVKKILLKVENKQSGNIGFIRFLVEDSSLVDINITNVDSLSSGAGYYIAGLPFNEIQQLYKTNFLSRRSALDAWSKQQYNEKRKFAFESPQRDSIEKLVQQQRTIYLDFVLGFMKDVRQSYLAYEVFGEELLHSKNIFNLGKEKILDAYKLLDVNHAIPESRSYVDSIVSLIKANAVGATVSDFFFKTDKNEIFSLKKFTEKAPALLIFTGKFCPACVAQIPAVRQIQSRMGAGLNILYISLDNTISDWQSSIKLRAYPGKQTVNLAPYNFNTDLQQKFFNQYIPQVFLIDRNQRIIYDSLSPYEDDDELLTLKEILGVKN